MKPILFNTEMVRAILEGRKTVTRRVVKDPYYIDNAEVCRKSEIAMRNGTNCTHGIPYPDRPYHPGDILWVRETWRPVSATIDFWKTGDPTTVDDGLGYQYKADGKIFWREDFKPQDDEFHTTEIRYDEKWRPSIHMPKEAARLFLRVTEVRVERLQDITEQQAVMEGIFLDSPDFIPTYHYEKSECNMPGRGWNTARECFLWGVWNSTIKPADLALYGWEANPWVWVIKFEKISKEAALGGGGDG